MSYTYPAPAPTLVGDVVTANRFLNSPTNVSRRVNEIALNRYIGDVLLSGRAVVEGGAVQYETQGTEYTTRSVEAISPGGEYPLATVEGRQANIAKVDKWGQDTLVTDEAIKRQRMSAVERGFTALVNTNVVHFDNVVLSLISSVVTATFQASEPWDGSGSEPNILRDLMRAKAQIVGLKLGYNPDTLVVDDELFAYVASDEKLAALMARENSGNVVYTGNFPVVAGLRVLPSPNLPPGARAMVVDTTMLGGIGNEDLGGGYQRVNGPVETKSIRDDDNDQWKLRARRVAVPYVTDPGAAIRVTDVTA